MSAAGKVSACFDWRLGAGVTKEPYCPDIEAQVLEPLARCSAVIDDIAAGDPGGIATLVSGLIASGVAMALQGDSRPASGAEHHVSHLWDLLAFRGRREHAPHGLQVGYATIFVTSLPGASVASSHAPSGRRPAPPTRRTHGGSERLTARSRRCGPTRRRPSRSNGPAWPSDDEAADDLRRRLEELQPLTREVLAALQRMGVPDAMGFLGVDAPLLRASLRFANRLRNRFTALDLLEAQGALDREIGELVTTRQ